jgi:5-methylcytosine-specific restriction endonuclease McrA
MTKPSTNRQGPKVWSGYAVTQAKKQVMAMYGTTCHLCGRPGANTVDHLIPRSIRPDLMFDLENMRPAHLSCNSGRKTRPLVQAEQARGW